MCDFCHRTDTHGAFLINAEGGYGQPEMRACDVCLHTAEEGSTLARRRDQYYDYGMLERPR